jgi:hypothetical protein
MKQQLNELLLQSLETELGGVQIYQTALGCVVNKDLQEEWEKYLDQTTRHSAARRWKAPALVGRSVELWAQSSLRWRRSGPAS